MILYFDFIKSINKRTENETMSEYCDYCNKWYSNKDQYKRHLNTEKHKKNYIRETNTVQKNTGRMIFRKVCKRHRLDRHQYWRSIYDIRENEIALNIWSVQRKGDEEEILFDEEVNAYNYLSNIMIVSYREERKRHEERKRRIFRRLKAVSAIQAWFRGRRVYRDYQRQKKTCKSARNEFIEKYKIKMKLYRRMKRLVKTRIGHKVEKVWRKPNYELKDGDEFLDTWAVSEKTPNDRTHTFDCIDDAYSAQFV